MANSLREVKGRIKSTKSTAQITKAMYMVSQSKVKKAEKVYKSYKDFMKRIASLTSLVVKRGVEDYEHPLLTKREIKKTGYLIITSDRGLAGAYNSNVYKALTEEIEKNHKSNDEFVCGAIGKLGFNYLKKMKYPLGYSEPILVRDDVMFLDIAPLSKAFINGYKMGAIDKLVIIHNHFINNLRIEIRKEEILPILSMDEEQIEDVDYVFETGVEKTIDLILPMYLQDMIYGIILDSKCSEHSARMNSMKSATDNANEIIDKLELLYNRARQNVITTELIDIISGANAIGGNK